MNASTSFPLTFLDHFTKPAGVQRREKSYLGFESRLFQGRTFEGLAPTVALMKVGGRRC